jgi:hypothetical protein
MSGDGVCSAARAIFNSGSTEKEPAIKQQVGCRTGTIGKARLLQQPDQFLITGRFILH